MIAADEETERAYGPIVMQIEPMITPPSSDHESESHGPDDPTGNLVRGFTWVVLLGNEMELWYCFKYADDDMKSIRVEGPTVQKLGTFTENEYANNALYGTKPIGYVKQEFFPDISTLTEASAKMEGGKLRDEIAREIPEAIRKEDDARPKAEGSQRLHSRNSSDTPSLNKAASMRRLLDFLAKELDRKPMFMKHPGSMTLDSSSSSAQTSSSSHEEQ